MCHTDFTDSTDLWMKGRMFQILPLRKIYEICEICVTFGYGWTVLSGVTVFVVALAFFSVAERSSTLVVSSPVARARSFTPLMLAEVEKSSSLLAPPRFLMPMEKGGAAKLPSVSWRAPGEVGNLHVLAL